MNGAHHPARTQPCLGLKRAATRRSGIRRRAGAGAGTRRARRPWLRVVAWCLILAAAAIAPVAVAQPGVPILVYHRFGPVATDPMVVSVKVFEEQLAWLRDHQYQIIPLGELVDSLRDPNRALPRRAVAITVDDGRASVYRDLLPLIRRYRFPVTLFVYPSAISNAAYALTWPQLAELRQTGLVDVQSHTWWHPNFDEERARRTPEDWRAFALSQLVRSRELIRGHLGGSVEMLAWPFGICDPELQRLAAEAGYVAAFTLGHRPATRADGLLALPRYLVGERDRGARFTAIVEAGRP